MSTASGPTLEGLRILEVTQRYPPALGGVERHVERLTEELTRRGAHVDVVTTDLVRDRPFLRGSFDDDAGPATVRRHHALEAFPAPHGVGIFAPGMLRDLLDAPADVIHAHAFGHFPLWAGRLVRATRRIPLVVTTHSDPGSDTALNHVWSRTVARATLRGADRTVALTRSEASWLASLGVPATRISVIPNGIDLPEFDGLPARPAPEHGPVVLFVGRLDPEQKGLEGLIRAFAEVPPRLRATLRIVGQDWGGLAGSLALANELGVQERVDFRGPVSRATLLREYATAHLFALPSRFDSFPIVLLEAMAAGLPVVATSVGGVPDVVEEGSTALLVPPEDPRALARAITDLLSDPARLDAFGRAGRARVTRFSWPSIGPEFVRMFASVATARG
jgi:glycosyltransferase involved in cell wall biosynthesis